ncbi:hypothetical protein ACSMXM_03580 [Pacificimonas sp. ICDLI1SI03]
MSDRFHLVIEAAKHIRISFGHIPGKQICQDLAAAIGQDFVTLSPPVDQQVHVARFSKVVTEAIAGQALDAIFPQPGEGAALGSCEIAKSQQLSRQGVEHISALYAR